MEAELAQRVAALTKVPALPPTLHVPHHRGLVGMNSVKVLTAHTSWTVRSVPLHCSSQELPAEAAQEAIVCVTPNIHSDLFLEIWLMFLSIYSLSLCLGHRTLLLQRTYTGNVAPY